VASNPGHIAAGGSEKISVVVDTKNRGGSTLHKGFTVFTNDPDKPKVHLQVTGKVEGYITVAPGYIRLSGPVGQPIQRTVNLTPHKGYPFAITEVKARSNAFVRFQLKPKGKNAPKTGYRLLVENIKSEAGNYNDTIIIKTDSPHKPILRIPIYGRIFTPQPPPGEGPAK
jgi:hypothetical protein